jgi:hypothetical protein
MELGRGWDTSDFELTKLRLIEYLAAQDAWAVPGLPDWASESGSQQNADAAGAMRELSDYGYLDNYRVDKGGNPTGMLNAHGRSAWRKDPGSPIRWSSARPGGA